MSKLLELQKSWTDVPEHHQRIHDEFCAAVNATPALKAHRDWVEQNMFGFGERSFHWMWKLIIDEVAGQLPAEAEKRFSFLEVGVFRGQVLSLVKLLADTHAVQVERFGITPLSAADGHWESDYSADICRLHDQFKLDKDYTLVVGLSTEDEVVRAAQATAQALGGFDIIYIDGGHAFETVVSDLRHYTPLVKPGGLLVVDDCANRFHMPWGYFQGIEPVSKAVDGPGGLPPFGGQENPVKWEFLFNVVHNRVWRSLRPPA